MRLAIYIKGVESARGAERVAVNVARGLAERSHQIDFLVEEEGGAWLTDELCARCANVTVVDLRNGREHRPTSAAKTSRWLADRFALLQVMSGILFSAPAALIAGRDPCIGPIARLLWKNRPPIWALCRYIRDARPHAVLSFLNYPNAVLLLASRRFHNGTRVLVSVRNHMSVAADANESNWVRSVPHLMRRLFERADVVVAPSQGVGDDVAAITGLARERISVIYNPVFRPELATLAEEPADHPWLAEGNEPVVLGVGKLKMQKDFPTLLKAFAQVRSRRAARLIILGEGDGEAELKALAAELGIADDVDFHGQVQNPFAFYRRAAVFVLSSRWEGLPNALIEAMACGCAVVSTDCPSGPREILEDGRFGALVPVGDVEAMADAILTVLSDPPAAAASVERARQFSLDAAVQRFEAVMAG